MSDSQPRCSKKSAESTARNSLKRWFAVWRILLDREKTLFRFVEKVHHRAQQITAQDMQPMYAAGWDDEAIYYVITICALFNFYDRLVGARGVHVLSDEAHRLAGKRSAETGYIRK